MQLISNSEGCSVYIVENFGNTWLIDQKKKVVYSFTLSRIFLFG